MDLSGFAKKRMQVVQTVLQPLQLELLNFRYFIYQFFEREGFLSGYKPKRFIAQRILIRVHLAAGYGTGSL